MPNPTISSAKITPSGQLLYVVPLKADGTSALGAISAVADGATITKNGVTTSLTDQVWSVGYEGWVYPLVDGPWAALVDDDDAGWSSTGTWTEHTPFNGVGGFFSATCCNGQFRTASAASATCTWTFAIPGPGKYRLTTNLWDLVGPDRATAARYTAKDGAGTTVGTFNWDLSRTLWPTWDRFESQQDMHDLGEVIIASGTSLTITLSNVGASGILVADGMICRRIVEPFATPGDTITATFPSGTATVSGTATDAATDLPVTFATEADISIVLPDAADRTTEFGINLDVPRETFISISLANRGYGSDVWEGACTLDSHYDMATCTGTVTRRLLYFDTGDAISNRGQHLFVDGDIKVTAHYAGITFDAAARLNIGLVGGDYDIGPATWTDLGGGYWRLTQSVARKAWEPIATRSADFSSRNVLGLVYQSTNAGLIITDWKWLDALTPPDYAGTAHPADVARLKGKVRTVRGMDLLGTNGSTACKVGDYTTPADRHAPDPSNSVNYQLYTINVLSIRAVDFNPATDADHFYRYFDIGNQVGWVVAVVDDATPLIGRDGSFCGIAGGATNTFASTVAGVNIIMTAGLGVYYLDDTHVLLMVHVDASYSVSPTPQWATVDQTYDTTGMILGASKPNSMPLEWIVAYCADLDASPWVNVPHAATDDLIDWMADTTIAGTPDGRKVYVEYSNEHWNTNFVQINYFAAMRIHANWLNGQDPVANPFTYPGSSAWFGRKSVRVHDRWRARFVAANRDPALVVGVVGSQTFAGAVTEDIVIQCAAEGLATGVPVPIDAFCVDGYQGVDPYGSSFSAADLAGSFARIDASGQLDMFALSTFKANKFDILNLHNLVKHDHGYAASELVTYESGPDFPGLYSPGPAYMNIEMLSHPRAYRYTLAYLALLQSIGITLDNRYRYASSQDFGSTHVWTDLFAAFSAPGTGDPAENRNYLDWPNVVAQQLGGRLGWVDGVNPDATTTTTTTTRSRQRNRLNPRRRRKLAINFKLPPRSKK